MVGPCVVAAHAVETLYARPVCTLTHCDGALASAANPIKRSRRLGTSDACMSLIAYYRLKQAKEAMEADERFSHARAESGVLFLLGEVACAMTALRPAGLGASALEAIAATGMTFIDATVCILIKLDSNEEESVFEE